jgi:GT2 family glycosyltransferase
MSAGIDLSVILASYNTRDLLARTLAALLAPAGQAGDGRPAPTTEVIVVDNASADGSAAMVGERFPAAIVVANAENRYYTAANNQGLAIGRGRHFLVLNPDAEPSPGTIRAMVDWIDARPEVGAMTTSMYFPDGRLQQNCARATTWPVLLLDYTALGLMRPVARRRMLDAHWYAGWDRTTAREVDVIPGSCMLVRREAIERAGGFDEGLRMYFAEDDWCGRIRATGFAVMYAPVGAVTHAESASVRQARRQARRIYFEDMARYAAKHFGPSRGALLRAMAWPTRLALDAAGLRGTD